LDEEDEEVLEEDEVYIPHADLDDPFENPEPRPQGKKYRPKNPQPAAQPSTTDARN